MDDRNSIGPGRGPSMRYLCLSAGILLVMLCWAVSWRACSRVVRSWLRRAPWKQCRMSLGRGCFEMGWILFRVHDEGATMSRVVKMAHGNQKVVMWTRKVPANSTVPEGWDSTSRDQWDSMFAGLRLEVCTRHAESAWIAFRHFETRRARLTGQNQAVRRGQDMLSVSLDDAPCIFCH